MPKIQNVQRSSNFGVPLARGELRWGATHKMFLEFDYQGGRAAI
jgi:hypothetical protein